MMREFNTFGPVNPQLHYHVNRMAVKAAMRAKIEKGRYFTLNAARQTGKTTLFREVSAELESEGNNLCLLIDFEALFQDDPQLIYEQISIRLREALELHLLTTSYPPELAQFVQETTVSHHHDLGHYLRTLGRLSSKSVIVIIDEFDSLPDQVMASILGVFRRLYLYRDTPQYYSPASMVLVGVHME